MKSRESLGQTIRCAADKIDAALAPTREVVRRVLEQLDMEPAAEEIATKRIEETGEPEMPSLFADPTPIEDWRRWLEQEARQAGGILTYSQFANAVGLKPRDDRRPGLAWDQWFRWHHLAVDHLGYGANLHHLAAEMGYAYSTVKRLHPKWQRSTVLIPF